MNPKHLNVRMDRDDGEIYLTEEKYRAGIRKVKNITQDVLMALCADLVAEDGTERVERDIRFKPSDEGEFTVHFSITLVKDAHLPDQRPRSGGRPYPELLSTDEATALLQQAERLWKDLQENNLGGFSNRNRPFHILHEFRRVIEGFGHRDVGLTWSNNDLEAALARKSG